MSDHFLINDRTNFMLCSVYTYVHFMSVVLLRANACACVNLYLYVYQEGFPIMNV